MPRRVFAKQRGAERSRSVGSVPSFDRFTMCPSLVDDADDRLATFVNMYVFDADCLFTATAQLPHRFDLRGHRPAAELCIAIEGEAGFQVAVPVVEALVAELIARKVDVLVIDPFVSSHGVNENDNVAIDAVAKTWARIASSTQVHAPDRPGRRAMGRIVGIATDGRHLSLHRGFLLVEQDRTEVGRIALDDIHAVIIHAHGTTWSANLVAALAERGAPMVICGSNHSPVAFTLPIAGHHAQNARFRAQWDASKPLAKQLWRRIVSAKIAMQGSLLAARDVAGADVFALIARRVKSGDTDNLEAQAARRYWPLLMGPDFRRNRDSPGANALLNYGYAVLRATVARAVVAAGLHPTIGINHANRGNALALADDLIEPFRPLVDALVVAMLAGGIDMLDPAVKRRFARLIAFDLRIDGEASPVSIAAVRLAQSLARAFESGRPNLTLFDPPLPIEWSALARVDDDSDAAAA